MNIKIFVYKVRYWLVSMSAVGLFLIAGLPAKAANVTFATNTTIPLTGSGITVTVLAGSNANAFAVGTNSITVTTAASETFSIRYAGPNPGSLGSDNGGVPSCNPVGTNNDVTVNGGLTVTFTPVANPICQAAAGGGQQAPGQNAPKPASINLTAPDGGAVYNAGDKVNVTWSATGDSIKKIRVLASSDGGATYLLVADNEVNDGLYVWTIPNIDARDARIKVEAYDSTLLLASDFSLNNFTIKPKVVDTTPTSSVSGEAVAVGDKELILTWKNPIEPDFDKVSILRNEKAFPTSLTDGKVVYEGKDVKFTDKELTNGVTYFYALVAYDTSKNNAKAAFISGTPQEKVVAPKEEPKKDLPKEEKKLEAPKEEPAAVNAIEVTKLPKVTQIKPGAKLDFEYKVSNTTAKRAKLTLLREIFDSNGKKISSVTGSRTLKVDQSTVVKSSYNVGSKQKVGKYVVRISAQLGKKVLGSGEFNFEVISKSAKEVKGVVKKAKK